MTYDELRSEVLPYNCCSPEYICPTLAKELIRADTDRQRKAAYEERKAAKKRREETPSR